jgi:hypothetical protein
MDERGRLTVVRQMKGLAEHGNDGPCNDDY